MSTYLLGSDVFALSIEGPGVDLFDELGDILLPDLVDLIAPLPGVRDSFIERGMTFYGY